VHERSPIQTVPVLRCTYRRDLPSDLRSETISFRSDYLTGALAEAGICDAIASSSERWLSPPRICVPSTREVIEHIAISDEDEGEDFVGCRPDRLFQHLEPLGFPAIKPGIGAYLARGPIIRCIPEENAEGEAL
jgi:hypothetical protein